MAPTSNNSVLKEETFIVERLGRKTPVFAVGPDTPVALPAVIVVHEIFGVNEHIKDVARRFAGQNFRAFAPDLFALCERFPSDPERRNDLKTMREVWSSIDDSELIAEMHAVFDAAARYPAVIPESIGAIGYCMGGAIALMFACSEGKLSWVADYYGRIKYGAISKEKPKHPIDYAGNLRCPLLGLFAGKDELITGEHREQLAALLQKNDKTFRIKVYEKAEHAFFNDQRPHYDREAAEDAWQLTLDFARLQNKAT
ncbi:MAG TPA: dienelactone hydrolase family protein [Planktothrix sp.]|jgi:carboxymethylenebutenolidase